VDFTLPEMDKGTWIAIVFSINMSMFYMAGSFFGD
jgi:hypothetical protein